MMTVEGRKLPQPPQGAAHQKAYSLPCPLDSPDHSTVPGDSRCLWDLHHLWDISPCTPSLSQSSLPSRGPVTSGSARSFRYGTLSFDSHCPALLDWPASLGPTLLARSNSLGPTLLARPNSLGPAHSTHSSQLDSTRLAQLTRPDSPNSTRPAQLTRPNSLAPAHSTQPSSPGPTQSTQLAQPAI